MVCWVRLRVVSLSVLCSRLDVCVWRVCALMCVCTRFSSRNTRRTWIRGNMFCNNIATDGWTTNTHLFAGNILHAMMCVKSMHNVTQHFHTGNFHVHGPNPMLARSKIMTHNWEEIERAKTLQCTPTVFRDGLIVRCVTIQLVVVSFSEEVCVC